MVFRVFTATVLALALSTNAGAAWSARVQKVKQLFDQLFYREALGVCNAALEAGRNSRAELVQLLGYRALIAGSLGQEAQATETFKRLLTIDPRAKLARGYAPRIRRAYDNALRFASKQGAITVAVEAPEAVARDGKLAIAVKLEKDPLGLAARAGLYLRAAGPAAASYATHPSGEGGLRWSLPLDGLPGIRAATAVDYYLAILDKDFNELTLVGSPEAPRRLRLTGAPPALPLPVATPVAPPPAPVERRRPLLTRWWLWTAIGAVVAATAIGVGVGVGARSERAVVTAPVTLETGP